MTQGTAAVGVLDVGPLAVDERGHVYASLNLFFETDEKTLGVELSRLELFGVAGGRVGAMEVAGQFVVTSPGHQQVFDGVVPARVFSLWSSVRLDATLDVLERAFPSAFLVELRVGAESVRVEGKIPPRNEGITA